MTTSLLLLAPLSLVAQDLDAGTASDVSTDVSDDACVCDADVDAECVCDADVGVEADAEEVAGPTGIEQKELIEDLVTQTKDMNAGLGNILKRLEQKVKKKKRVKMDFAAPHN